MLHFSHIFIAFFMSILLAVKLTFIYLYRKRNQQIKSNSMKTQIYISVQSHIQKANEALKNNQPILRNLKNLTSCNK